MTKSHAIRGPVFVAGPPGAGKSTLSRMAADQLALAWLDTDDEVERRIGLTPAGLIEQRGEPALRAEELDIVSELEANPMLVALGGGAWIDPATRAEARRRGPVVGLTADRDVLWSRIQGGRERRPLCPNREQFDRLMDEREPIYARTDATVRTDGAAPDRALLDAVHGLGFVAIDMGVASTRVVVGHALAATTGAAVADLEPTRPVFVLEDANAPASLRAAHVEAVARLGVPLVRHELPGGEAVKTWRLLGDLLEDAVAQGCGRQSVVVGIGGGAVCDLAAMLGGLLGRGAPLVLVPTTLLAQVDAAIGGKAAVNAGDQKNPVGLFAPARDVIADLDFLASLDRERLGEGLAESYKAALLSSDADRAALVDSRQPTVDSVLRSIETKARIVTADPWEAGLRKVLNLGHTWGHAVEAASDHRIPHGHAVAIGIAFIARWSAAKGLSNAETRDRILADLKHLGLPAATPRQLFEPALTKLRADKKGGRARVDLVALRGVGRPEIVNHSWEELERELLELEG
jgi:3-dehydroquinate synthetase/shikimate kinase